MLKATEYEPKGGGGGGGCLCSAGISTCLLAVEHVLAEVMVEPLSGEVDAELLKAVCLVVLESKDVKDADRETLKRAEEQNVYCIKTSHMPGKIKGYVVCLLFLCVRMCMCVCV